MHRTMTTAEHRAARAAADRRAGFVLVALALIIAMFAAAGIAWAGYAYAHPVVPIETMRALDDMDWD